MQAEEEAMRTVSQASQSSQTRLQGARLGSSPSMPTAEAKQTLFSHPQSHATVPSLDMQTQQNMCMQPQSDRQGASLATLRQACSSEGENQRQCQTMLSSANERASDTAVCTQ